MKEKLAVIFQNFGRVIVDPVLYLAVVGIVLAISTVCSITNVPFLTNLGTLLSAATNSAIIGNLALVLCVGLTAGFAKKQKANAAVFGLMSYIMFLYVNNAYLTMTGQLIADGAAGMGLFATGQAIVLGLQVTDINVFGGIIIGCLAAWIYNKAIDIKVPEVLKIYGGPRLALLIMIPVIIVFSIAVTVLWPPVANFINNMSAFIRSSGGLGVFLFGFLNRSLIPTGLHHFLWMPFDFTAIGGTAVIDGATVNGAANIFYAEMPLIANGTLTTLDSSIRFASFGFAKEFLTLGAALAMIYCARPENKKAVAAMIIPVYITASLAGITEAMDFIILFASPWLWIAKGMLTGLGEMTLFLLGIKTYNIYGFIELFTINLTLPWSVTKFPLYILVGLAFVVITFVVFTALIKKFNFMTPGRAADWGQEAGTSETTALPNNEIVTNIIEGLGGKDNIKTMGCCMTRLRTQVVDQNLVKEDLLKKVSSKGIVRKGNEVQVIIGLNVHDIYDLVKPALKIED